MTIPTLIANTNGAKYRSQFKKTVSTLNQAGVMAQGQYDFDYAGTTDTCQNGATDHPENVFTFCSLLNGTLTGKTFYQDLSDIKRDNHGVSDTYKVVKRYTLDGITDNTEIQKTSYHAYVLSDGAIVAFKYRAVSCELPAGTQLTSDLMPQSSGNNGASYANLNKCVGFIDVNGPSLPNKEVSCTYGTTSREVEKPCSVKNDATHMTDIFPIVFHDATVEPASNAAKYVLTTTK
jgi:hypothetical protein